MVLPSFLRSTTERDEPAELRPHLLPGRDRRPARVQRPHRRGQLPVFTFLALQSIYVRKPGLAIWHKEAIRHLVRLAVQRATLEGYQ